MDMTIRLTAVVVVVGSGACIDVFVRFCSFGFGYWLA